MKKIIAALAVIMMAGAAFAAIAPAADAAIKVKRCAWWNLNPGDDVLVLEAVGNSTTCAAARAVGDAYLDARGFFPRKLYAASKTWTIYADSKEHVGGKWRYYSMQYRAYTSNGKWQSVHVEYDY